MSGIVLPQIDDVNRPFWDGCRDGVLLLQRCSDCEAWSSSARATP